MCFSVEQKQFLCCTKTTVSLCGNHTMSLCGNHTMSLCGNHTGVCGRRRRAVAPTQTPLVSTHTPKIAIPLLGGNILASQDVWPPTMLARAGAPRDPKSHLFAAKWVAMAPFGTGPGNLGGIWRESRQISPGPAQTSPEQPASRHHLAIISPHLATSRQGLQPPSQRTPNIHQIPAWILTRSLEPKRIQNR